MKNATEVMLMSRCAMCDEELPVDCATGDVCPGCAKRYDECGVYLCLG